MLQHSDSGPWFRQPWPWLLMVMPATAVIAGFATLWLAIHSNNSLVVDDYYREGRAINVQIGRDRHAAELGLRATLESSAAGGVRVRLHSRTPTALPAALTLRLVHATEAALDVTVSLPAIAEAAGEGDGADGSSATYGLARAALPGSGRWTVRIEDADRKWRLSARAERFDAPIGFRAEP